MSLIATSELLTGLGTYLSEQSLAQYNSDGEYVEDPGRPGIRFSDSDHPDTLLVLAVVGVDRGLFQVAMSFRAGGRDASGVDGIADAVTSHFDDVFIGGRVYVGGTVATPMPSITLDDLILNSVTRKTRGAVTIAAPKPQLNTNRFSRVDTYAVSVSRK